MSRYDADCLAGRSNKRPFTETETETKQERSPWDCCPSLLWWKCGHIRGGTSDQTPSTRDPPSYHQERRCQRSLLFSSSAAKMTGYCHRCPFTYLTVKSSNGFLCKGLIIWNWILINIQQKSNIIFFALSLKAITLVL